MPAALVVASTLAFAPAPSHVRAGARRPDPSAGCTAAHGTRTRATTTAHALSGRDYLLALPKGSARTPVPLILLFHGSGSNARAFASLTRMPAEATRRGVAVVVPNGTNRTWQLDPAQADGRFVDSLLAHVERTRCIDLRRVGLVGFSAGGAFAITYGCAREATVAAIVSGAVDYQLGCKTPIPVAFFHGTADLAVPYADGATGLALGGLRSKGTLRNVADWAALDGCRATPTDRRSSSEVVRSTFGGCAPRGAVVLYTIDGGAHAWPGADPKRAAGLTTQQLDATKVALDFVLAHPLPRL